MHFQIIAKGYTHIIIKTCNICADIVLLDFINRNGHIEAFIFGKHNSDIRVKDYSNFNALVME